MNVSSVKNLNGETFSAVQDATLTDVVQSNSAQWNEISAYEQASGTFLTAHQSLDDYATTADVDSISSMLSGAIDYVSANAGYEFPVSADEAVMVVESNSSTWNETSNVVQSNSARWAEGGTTYTSPSGTILINGDTLEGTNSAISVGYEGFVSSYGACPVGPNDTARYTWDKALPNTIITLDTWATRDTLYWSANTDLTGEIVLPEAGRTTQSISIPNATAFAAWSNSYHNLGSTTVSAADTETVVGELAWASALPTYEYDNTNKISAINGSALAGGGSVFPSSADEAVQCVQTNSGTWGDVTNKLDTTAFTSWSSTQADNNYQLSAGDGVSIVDDNINKITRIDVTAQGGDEEVNTLVHTNSATWNETSTTVQTNSAQWGQGGGNPEVESYVTTNSGIIDNVNTTYQTKSASYLTAHQSLDGYATTAWVTGRGYLTAVSLSSLNTAQINNIIVTASLPGSPNAKTLYLIKE